MVQKICSNPECKKPYFVKDESKDDSMGCCSFECWEKVFCKEPEEVEHLSIL